MDTFNEIIKKIGEELGIKVTHLSDNWLTILEKDGEIHYLQGYKFPLNDHAIGNILDDKGLFYDLCKMKNIPIIEHNVIFSDYKKEDVLNYFNNHGKKIVVKGNIGTCGLEVFKIENQNDLFKCIDTLFLKEFSISLCPYYDIVNEYRVIVLNNEARVIYGKEKPHVIGDGIHNVLYLAKKYNDYYLNNPIDNYDYIPLNGEEIELNFQFNLSRGAVMFTNIDDELKKIIIDLALMITKKLNITFASIDVIKTVDNKLLVMEANSGVMMDNYIRFMGEEGYLKAYNLYKDAIMLIFHLEK